jgi:hypothetical protein
MDGKLYPETTSGTECEPSPVIRRHSPGPCRHWPETDAVPQRVRHTEVSREKRLMPTGTRLNAPHATIGLCVMALGIALVLDRLGVVPAEQVLQYWPLGLVLLGASMVFQAIRGGPDAAVRGGFPIGAAIWLVLIGLLLTHVFERRSSARDQREDHLRLFAIMSGDRRSVVDTPFHGADMTAVMGGVRLDLLKARVAPGEEVAVDVFAVMGGAELQVPRNWVVDIKATSIMGGVKDSRGSPFGIDASNRPPRRRGRDGDVDLPLPPLPPTPPADPLGPIERADDGVSAGPPPRLVVRGFVMMGGLVIKP